MKRLLAVPAVLAVLALPSVAAAPASAATGVSYGGYSITVTCNDSTGLAEYTVTIKTPQGSVGKTFPLGRQCLIGS
jgi:hypothetical protein